MRTKTLLRIGAVLGLAAAVGTCGDDGTGPPAEPVIATISVTSAIDTLIAVGYTAQLTATAMDADGNVVSGRTLTWSSSNAAVGGVSASGVFTALSAGRTRITVSTGDVSGSLELRVIAADLDAIGGYLGDGLVQLILATFSPTALESVQVGLAEATQGLLSGNCVLIYTGLQSATAGLDSATEPTDRVLAAALRLVLERAAQSLNL